MINTVSLLFSLLAVAYVTVRAAMLDKTLPWFKANTPEDSARKAKPTRPYR